MSQAIEERGKTLLETFSVMDRDFFFSNSLDGGLSGNNEGAMMCPHLHPCSLPLDRYERLVDMKGAAIKLAFIKKVMR